MCMLPKERADFYFRSLHFNHYESGGTCEQRVLVLRARFDRILEELSIKDFDSQGAYVEKLQQIFAAMPAKFPLREQKECHALRKYLNGVQHSTFETDEYQYAKSLERLCKMISICSDVKIPEKLEEIWKKTDISINNQKSINNIDVYENGTNNQATGRELPLVICVDCLYIEDNEQRRSQFNQALLKLISEIADNDLDINLRLILIGGNKIKYVVPLTGEVSTFNYQQVDESILIHALDNSYAFINSRLNYYKEMKINIFNPSSIFVLMLSSELSKMLKNSSNTISLEKEKHLQVIPIGLTKGMNTECFKYVSEKSKGMILREDKYIDFFNWLNESLLIICKKKK